jgi:hypothetical protein
MSLSICYVYFSLNWRLFVTIYLRECELLLKYYKIYEKSYVTRARLFDLCNLCLNYSNDTNNVGVKLAIFCFLKIPRYNQAWSKYRSEIAKIICL